MTDGVKYYNPNQLEVLLPFLEGVTPAWLVLGGPADGNEAQTAAHYWPDIEVLACEPNPEAWAWVKSSRTWPPRFKLLTYGLADRPCHQELVREPGKIRNASFDHESVEGNRGNPDVIYSPIRCTTLDFLDGHYGPFKDAIVWLDIEGSEVKALRGAERLIRSGRVLAWNLEVMDRVPGIDTIPNLLHGYKPVKDWDVSAHCRNRIFLREDLIHA